MSDSELGTGDPEVIKQSFILSYLSVLKSLILHIVL